jgi:hypothetical protein
MQKKVSNPRDSRRSLQDAEFSSSLTEDLWVRPTNLRPGSRRGVVANISPESGQRFLDLADIALGTKKQSQVKKKSKPIAAATHQKRKTAPYSG